MDFMISNHQEAKIKLNISNSTESHFGDDKLLQIGLTVQVDKNEQAHVRSALPIERLTNDGYLDSCMRSMIMELAAHIADTLNLKDIFKKQIQAAQLIKE